MPETRINPTPEPTDASSRTASVRPHFSHVLACLDHSPHARKVLAEAAAIADVLGAELTALRVMEAVRLGSQPIDPVDWDLARREEEAEVRQLAEEIAAPAGMHTAVLDGVAADCICRMVRDAGVDLTVMGVGARGEMAERGLGSTVRRVAEQVAGSVMVVPAGGPGDAPRRGPTRRILVPLDSSPQAEAVLPIAAQIAQGRAAELVLLHAVPDISLTGSGPPEASDRELCDQILRRNERAAQSYLDRIRRFLPADAMRTRVRLLSGEDPRHALARAVSEERADLVVLSARGLGSHPELSLGSTAEYLMSGTTAPVLLVRLAKDASRRSRQAAPQRPRAVRTLS